VGVSAPRTAAGGGEPLRLLALISAFEWSHVDYLHALAERFELTVGHLSERHEGAVACAQGEGLRVRTAGDSDGEPDPARLAELIAAVQPDAIHALYYKHEELVLRARELAAGAVLAYECRDPLTLLHRAPGRPTEKAVLERLALQESDCQLFVSGGVRAYFEQRYGAELAATSMLVPHGFALRTAAAPQPKLSSSDGETHLALVGTASNRPGHSRYYVEIIDRLTELGFVVHSHFFELARGANQVYRKLARRNKRYLYHPAISPRGTRNLSRQISRYDLMGVFHDLAATEHSESDLLTVSMPMKAASGWFHGAIPVVCSPHYGGVVEQIEAHGIGFVAEGWDALGRLVGARQAISAATERTLAVRARFSNEWNARRIETFVGAQVARATQSAGR
jgi:hypothetical protein